MNLHIPTEAEVWLGVGDAYIAFYDRAGNRIPMIRAAELSQDPNYHRVAWTEVAGIWHVSTVWMGLCASLVGLGPPEIFETMVFENAKSNAEGFSYHANVFDHFQRRWSTETEAREGHAATVAAARELFLPAVLR